MPEPTVEMLLAYLREHGASHDLGALRRSMAEQGANPERIEQAVALYREERETSGRKPAGWSIVFGCLSGFGLAAVSFVILIFDFFLFTGRAGGLYPWVVLVLGVAGGIAAVWVAVRPLLAWRR